MSYKYNKKHANAKKKQRFSNPALSDLRSVILCKDNKKNRTIDTFF